MTSFFPSRSVSASVPTYASYASLPVSGSQGDLAITLDTNTLYEWTGSVWGAIGVSGSTIVAVTDTAKIDLTNTAGTLSATVVAGSLADVDISASAAIALSKLASVTASRALVSDGAGAVSASGVTSTELGYVSGVSSPIQTQINSKAPTASPTFTGTVTVPVGPGVMKASALGTVSASAITNSDVSAAAAIDVTKLATGTANQLLGANAAGTANEFKTLSTGTTGSNFAIAHSAGGIAFNLPDAGASARGAVTTGTQTLAGAKTLSGITTVSNSTSSSTPSNGALVVSGGAGVGGQLTASAVQTGTVGSAAGAINVSQSSGTTLVDNYGPTPTGNHGSVNFSFRYSDGGGLLTPFSVTPTNFTVSSANAKITSAYGNTTAAAPNVYVASDGSLSRATTAIAPAASPTFTGTVTFPTGTGVLHSSSGGVVSSSSVVNADVNAAAAIDGSKIVAASGSVSGVVTTGTQTIAGAKTLSGITSVTNTTASTAYTNGALVVNGGVGVAGAINAGSYIKTTNSLLLAGSGTTTPSAGQASFDSVSAQLYISQLGTTTGGAHNGVIAISAYDSAIANASNIVVTSGGVSMNNTTDSTSLSTGSLRLAGGLGVTKAVVARAVAAVGTGSAGNTTTNHPYLATKLIILASSASDGGQTSTPHGLTGTNIAGYTAILDYSGSGDTVPPGYTHNAQYQFNINVNATHVVIELIAGNNAAIRSKNVRVLIQYFA